VFGKDENSFLITGTTHPRELLSSQAPLFILLKLLHQGVIQDNKDYEMMLAKNKFFIIPIMNPDGSKYVE